MGATACVRPEKIGCRMRAAVIVVLLSAVIFEASHAAVPEFEADEFEAFNGNTELVADYKPKAKHSPKKAKHSKFEKSQKAPIEKKKCEAEKKVKAAAEQKLKNMRTGKAERERKAKCEKADKAAEKQRKEKAAKKENEKKAK